MSSSEGGGATGLAPPLNLASSNWTAASNATGTSSSSSATAKEDASSDRKAADFHSRPDNSMAPSVQFDEQSLLATPSAQRRGDNASLPSSPAAGAAFLNGSPKASLQHRREASGSHRAAGPSHLSGGHHHQRVSSRASASGSSINGASGSRAGTGSRRSRANPTIVTVPVWARDESPSPPHTPYASPKIQSSSRSTRDMEPLSLTAAATRSQERMERSISADRRSDAPTGGPPPARAISPEVLEEAEEREAQNTNPDRWWTFTLPQKYRSRLHEHHLRMAFQDERMRTETLQKEEHSSKNQSRNKKKGSTQERPPRRSNSGSMRSDASSDGDDSDYEMQDSRGRDRDDNHHTYGLGAGTWSMAAGLGASGLLSKISRGTSQSGNAMSPSGRSNTDQSRMVQDRQRQDSPSPDGTSTTRHDDRDLEKQQKQDAEPDYPTMSFRARAEHPDVYTVHQPATPGWASPWKPEERGHGHFNAAGYFPRTESGRTIRTIDGGKNSWIEAWKTFLIHNPFVPLLFRLINLAFTAATLAIAIKLLIVLRQEGANDAVGASPLVAIIFAPLSLLHVGFQIWLEYFGRPIGLWTVQSKLSYTVVELVFICLWSSELSLTFDNYFTSTLICVNYGSPYAGPRETPSNRVSPLNNPHRKPYICRLQGSLIGLVFVSLLAYLIVLTVSLFRIFVRVTGGGRR